jgi:competence protein ComEA
MSNNLWKFISLGSLVVVALLIGIGAFVLRGRPTAEPIQIVPPEATATTRPTVTPGPIVAYVSGEVAVPDVYELPPGSRIKQLVEAAGGFTAEADTAAVNLAQPISDGAHVHVPAEGEAVPLQANSALGGTAVPDKTMIEVRAATERVNINNAGLEELESLPGIGPVTAQSILDYRAVNGAFPNIEAIMEVYGIGPAKFDKIKALITTGNE